MFAQELRFPVFWRSQRKANQNTNKWRLIKMYSDAKAVKPVF